ncbi:ABC transporter ATP-binding protein [candidate division WWE3 bacterium]|jgi:ABC-type multidrug transport system fused ATPase/permease subunit|uniref:ABC transporter ATP-binding protein n=1 Tax=candidate division WWE3 bacterium TaxID=2053526 RepID=A0A3A4ZG84_UNCKA|nr:MAG: ABC transporter ATP-binding protein [candidate division WWE3 bacterium]
MKMLKDVLFLLGESRKHLYRIVVFIFAMEVGRVAGNEFFVRLVDNVVETSQIMWVLMFGWIGVSLINWWFDGGADYYIVKMLVGVEYVVPLRSLKHLVTLSMRFFSDAGTGKVAKKIEQGADGLARLLESFSWEVVSSTIQITVTTVYLTTVLKEWGIVLIITAVIFICLTLWLDKLKRGLRKRRYDLYEICGHLLFQIMQNMAIVKAFAKEEAEVTRYEAVRSEIHDTSLKEFRYEMWFNILRGSLISVTLGVIFYLGVRGISAGEVKVGSIVGAMNLATASLFSLFRLTRILIRFMDNYEAISRTVEFLREVPDVIDVQNAIEVSSLAGDVVFDHVHFSYGHEGDKDRECLVDISFSVPAGKTVAIVGPSGSGKTTLISLLLRFMDPTSGVIKVGGHDIRMLTQSSYRKHLSVVLQDSLLFDRTLGDNVAGGLDVSDYTYVEDDIWDALHQAHAADFVKTLPGGKALGTMIGERGVKLSGGQRQRVAIAAALIRRPVVLVLDEATSSLDTQSERAIQKAMRNLQSKGETTIFVIAHRLSTVREADIIMVLNEGRLVQMGSHEELLGEEDGLYAQMVGVQNVN